MFSRDVITAAVASSCLLLMVASQSVKACSCYEPIVETGTCLADEIWELTVETKENVKGRGDELGSVKYRIHMDKVMKSTLGLTDGKEGFFKIEYSSLCTVNFMTNAQYFLAAGMDPTHHSPVQICVNDENDYTSCKVYLLEDGQVKANWWWNNFPNISLNEQQFSPKRTAHPQVTYIARPCTKIQ